MDVRVRLMRTAQCAVLREEEEPRSDASAGLRMTRWESAAAPFFPVTVREGDGCYVTGAPPPACCTQRANTSTHSNQTHPRTG